MLQYQLENINETLGKIMRAPVGLVKSETTVKVQPYTAGTTVPGPNTGDVFPAPNAAHQQPVLPVVLLPTALTASPRLYTRPLVHLSPSSILRPRLGRWANHN